MLSTCSIDSAGRRAAGGEYGLSEVGPDMPRAMAPDDRAARGRRAEDAVARRLWWNGYKILDRNFTTRGGEVDIIARKGDTVVFVEVKARKATAAVAPKDQVGVAQERRIDGVASVYLKARGLTDVSVRYDIAEVWLSDKGKPKRIEILEAAFGEPRR
ncbi:MAG TPA: YraN family protein [Armatimonadota bacterium]|nr:YraN family protein [Armatimonadota bacterium]